MARSTLDWWARRAGRLRSGRLSATARTGAAWARARGDALGGTRVSAKPKAFAARVADAAAAPLAAGRAFQRVAAHVSAGPVKRDSYDF